MVILRSIYNPWGASYAKQFLIESQEPRHPDGSDQPFNGRLKDTAPSGDLRSWFADNRGRWTEFRQRYFAELDTHPQAWQTLLDQALLGGVELVYNSHDGRYNYAVALKQYLEAKLPVVVWEVRVVPEWPEQ